MSTIVISPSNVVSFPEGGGHFWVYLQYVRGFLSLGCEVYWLERFTSSGDEKRDADILQTFSERMERFGLRGKFLLYTQGNLKNPNEDPAIKFLGVTDAFAESVFRRADLLLNFFYAMSPFLLSKFNRTALVDIDPGLLQFWIGNRQITVPSHDNYLTIGETVGTPRAKFPDCGLSWIHIRPPICLELWPYRFDSSCRAFSTISTWWGDEWITNGSDVMYENNKRVTFLQFITLPKATTQEIELALNFGAVEDDDPGSTLNGASMGDDDGKLLEVDPLDQESYGSGDTVQRKLLLRHGWSLRHSYDVASTPDAYRSYIQSSRGEFSCVKPSCLHFQNAWISDRTICYLASGKPVVIQDTGPSDFLPHGEGMFRFTTIEDAAAAFDAINSNYEKHCKASRAIAEEFFDAGRITKGILEDCLGAKHHHPSRPLESDSAHAM